MLVPVTNGMAAEKVLYLCFLSPHPQRSGANLMTATPSLRPLCAHRPTAWIQMTLMSSMTEILSLIFRREETNCIFFYTLSVPQAEALLATLLARKF